MDDYGAGRTGASATTSRRRRCGRATPSGTASRRSASASTRSGASRTTTSQAGARMTASHAVRDPGLACRAHRRADARAQGHRLPARELPARAAPRARPGGRLQGRPRAGGEVRGRQPRAGHARAARAFSTRWCRSAGSSPTIRRGSRPRRWADDVLQQWARRMVAAAGVRNPDSLAGRGADGRLGVLLTSHELSRRVVARAVLMVFRASKAQQRDDLSAPARSSTAWTPGSTTAC